MRRELGRDQGRGQDQGQAGRGQDRVDLDRVDRADHATTGRADRDGAMDQGEGQALPWPPECP